jgi:hypothetical protein
MFINNPVLTGQQIVVLRSEEVDFRANALRTFCTESHSVSDLDPTQERRFELEASVIDEKYEALRTMFEEGHKARYIIARAMMQVAGGGAGIIHVASKLGDLMEVIDLELALVDECHVAEWDAIQASHDQQRLKLQEKNHQDMMDDYATFVQALAELSGVFLTREEAVSWALREGNDMEAYTLDQFEMNDDGSVKREEREVTPTGRRMPTPEMQQMRRSAEMADGDFVFDGPVNTVEPANNVGEYVIDASQYLKQMEHALANMFKAHPGTIRHGAQPVPTVELSDTGPAFGIVFATSDGDITDKRDFNSLAELMQWAKTHGGPTRR